MGKKCLGTNHQTFEHSRDRLPKTVAVGTAAVMAGLGLCLAVTTVPAAIPEGVSSLPTVSASQDPAASPDPIVVPTVVENAEGNVIWGIDSDGTLTIAPEDGQAGTMDLGTDMSPWYKKATYVKVIKVTGRVKIHNAFNANSGLFAGCSNCESMDLSGLDTSEMSSMSFMFEGCKKMKTIDITGFDTSACRNMYYMFSNCLSLESLDFSSFDTSKVENMHFMFTMCQSLKSLDLSGFDISKVGNMSCMFNGCVKLEKVDVSSFDMMSHRVLAIAAFANADSLRTIVLGPKTSFGTDYPEFLADHDGYTGKWIREDGKYGPFTPEEMTDAYKGGDMAGVWVAEPVSKTYTVSFDANGGSGTMPEMTWTVGKPGAVPSSLFSWARHEFVGWNTQADGSGTTYAVGQIPGSDLAGANGTVTLYAQWKDVAPRPTTVTLAVKVLLDGNVPQGGSTMPLVAVPVDADGNAMGGAAATSGIVSDDGQVEMGPVTVSEEGTSYYAIRLGGSAGSGLEMPVTVMARVVTVMADNGTLVPTVEYSADGGQSWAGDMPTLRLVTRADASGSEGMQEGDGQKPQDDAEGAKGTETASDDSSDADVPAGSGNGHIDERKMREQYDDYMSQTGDGMTLGIVPTVSAGITGLVAAASRLTRRRRR